jgi:hypothetical protein
MGIYYSCILQLFSQDSRFNAKESYKDSLQKINP